MHQQVEAQLKELQAQRSSHSQEAAAGTVVDTAVGVGKAAAVAAEADKIVAAGKALGAAAAVVHLLAGRKDRRKASAEEADPAQRKNSAQRTSAGTADALVGPQELLSVVFLESAGRGIR